jgi:hypothetical protein
MTDSTESSHGGLATPAAHGARVPDFFIVGHPKSGTTALYEMLKAHPQIFMPLVKEPRWFAPDQIAGLPGASIPGPRPQLPGTRSEYLALFAPAPAGQRTGEASTSYLRSVLAAERIAAERPDARIIAILREPAGFLRSIQLELVQNRVESERDLARALEREQLVGARSAAGSEAPPPRTRYTDRVRYVEQLRRYHAVFPREQVLVLIYDDFRADNEGTLRKVLRFLDVDDRLAPPRVEANPTVHVRFLGADRMLARLEAAQGPVARAAKDAVKGLALDRPIRRLARRTLYGAPPPAEEALMRDLRRRFKDEVQALGDYLERDLVTLWGYDRLD